MSSAPIVNEIKSEAAPAPEQPVTESSGVAAAAPANTVALDEASSSLLQQIVADLSNLKEEINSLKTNLAEIKAKESSGIVEEPVEEPVADEAPAEDASIPDDFEVSEEAPVFDEAFTEDAPAEDVPAEDVPAEDDLTEDVPAEDAPVEDVPEEDVLTEDDEEMEFEEDSEGSTLQFLLTGIPQKVSPSYSSGTQTYSNLGQDKKLEE